MPSCDKENAKTSTTNPPPLPPVFPPLPPLPPPDATDSFEAAAGRSHERPRKFGRRLVENTLRANNNFHPGAAVMTAQKLNHQQQQHKIQTFEESKKAKEAPVEVTYSVIPTTSQDNAYVEQDKKPSLSSPLPPARHYGQSIWSVTPEELSAFAMEAAAKTNLKENAMKLSYAEVNKRKSHFPQQSKTMEATTATPVFKKYFALPTIPSAQSPRSEYGYVDAIEKASPTIFLKQDSIVPDQRAFALSAETPTFYPRQPTDSNDIIHLLKSSLASKKIAPHMDWWPGDWKCTNCGNHVLLVDVCSSTIVIDLLIDLHLQNFSYRETCKRCRVGRFEDAGFVFPPSSNESSA